MSKEAIINNLIRKEQVDTNIISDGYHTFGELYAHRIELFITLARIIETRSLIEVWRFKDDKEWFILGISKASGKQITYHLPISKWKDTEFAYTCSIRPQYDGHTSKDVIERLKFLL